MQLACRVRLASSTLRPMGKLFMVMCSITPWERSRGKGWVDELSAEQGAAAEQHASARPSPPGAMPVHHRGHADDACSLHTPTLTPKHLWVDDVEATQRNAGVPLQNAVPGGNGLQIGGMDEVRDREGLQCMPSRATSPACFL